MRTPLFYLQDSRGLTGENMMFWAIGGGYTSDISKAESFSKASAIAQHGSRESDIPWPAAYIHSHFYPAVDMQDLRHIDRNSRDVAFYRQLPGKYSGNDVFWESAHGATTDLSLALVFSSLSAGYLMWPVEEIQKIARPAVRARDVSITDALRDTGIVLQKPKRVRRSVSNCVHCGRFLSESQIYFDCPKCGGENRP